MTSHSQTMFRRAQAMARGLGFDAPVFLGEGSQGWVFRVTPGRVLKISSGLTEAAIATVIQRAQRAADGHPMLPTILAVHEIEIVDRGYLSAVLREDVPDVHSLPKGASWLLNLMGEALEYGGPSDDEMGSMRRKAAVDGTVGTLDGVLDLLAWSERHGLALFDVWSENWGQRAADGSLVLRDFGKSRRFPGWLDALIEARGLPRVVFGENDLDAQNTLASAAGSRHLPPVNPSLCDTGGDRAHR